MRKLSYVYCIVLLTFMLGIHEGKIALWKDEDPEPIHIFPYSADLLPPADKNALEDGIRFNSNHDLNRLLEDYLS